MSSIVHLQNITYKYGKKKALNNVSLELEKNVIYGLWGRNGAGKTTLMKLLTGLLKVQQGTIKVFGNNPYENNQVLQHVCFIQENHPLHAQWKIKQALYVSSCFFANWDEAKAKLWLERFGLNPKVKIKTLSKGMKTALSIVIGMASNSPLTIFDEPTNGLDAATREIFHNGLLEEYEKMEDRTFIISSHYITEWKRMIGNLVVLHEGEMIKNEELDLLQNRAVHINGTTEDLGAWCNHQHVLEEKRMGSMVSLMVEQELLEEMTKLIDENKVTIEPVALQDYLLRKTSKREGVTV